MNLQNLIKLYCQINFAGNYLGFKIHQVLYKGYRVLIEQEKSQVHCEILIESRKDSLKANIG